MKAISILALQKIPGVGAKTIDKILSLTDILEPATPSDLIEILNKAKSKFERILVPDIQAASIGWDQAHEIWKISLQHGIQIISKDSPFYPNTLLQIHDPPALLHVKGNIEALKKDCIAIVGTRNPTELGYSQAKKLGDFLAKQGYKGVDSAAHEGALGSKGSIIAVLAHGLDSVYPNENKKLANYIIENNGALISEYPWGTKSQPSFFISRNRIQSGLSLGVFVVETKIKGGTMHTVRFCEKQKRVLIVLSPSKNLIKQPSIHGNIQLISNNRADVIFKNCNDLDLVKTKIKNVKDALSNFEKSSQKNPSISIKDNKKYKQLTIT